MLLMRLLIIKIVAPRDLINFLTIVTVINDVAVERLMKEKNMSKRQAKQFLIDNCTEPPS